MQCCEYDPWDPIHNPSFSSKLKNGLSKLECFITLDWEGMSVTNTFSLLGPFLSYNCCEYDPWDPIHNPSFSSKLMNGLSKLECLTTPG